MSRQITQTDHIELNPGRAYLHLPFPSWAQAVFPGFDRVAGAGGQGRYQIITPGPGAGQCHEGGPGKHTGLPLPGHVTFFPIPPCQEI